MKEDYTVREFDNAGIWERRDSVALVSISESLDVADTRLASAEVDSIPSMWARPLLFEMALYMDDTNHPMHKRILGEWRGLLTMLALKEWCGFPLTIKQININDMGNPSDDNDFLKALQRLIPKARDTLDGKTTWETLNIILFNDKPIGITSPTTLVCTSVNCFGRISGVPWFNEKSLEDPVHKLNSFEQEAVAGWLQKLYESTESLPNRNIKDNLRGLLHDFIDELESALAVTDFSNTGPGLGFTQDLFKSMNNPIEPRDLPSSIELVPSSNKQPETKLLVFDQTIPKACGVEPQNVLIWKGKTLATTQSSSGASKPCTSDARSPPKSTRFFHRPTFLSSIKKKLFKSTTL